MDPDTYKKLACCLAVVAQKVMALGLLVTRESSEDIGNKVIAMCESFEAAADEVINGVSR